MTDAAFPAGLENTVPNAATHAAVGQRSWLGRLFAAGLMGVTFVLSAEVVARVDDYFRLGTPLLHVPNIGRDLVIRDSLGVRGRPNGRYKKWKLNSAGFRSPESVLTPKPGCIRVMMLGTSETYGGGAEREGKEFPAQLSDSLAKVGCFQVINASIVGQPLMGLTHLWNVWASRYQPDIVVLVATPGTYLAAFPQLVGAAPAKAAPATPAKEAPGEPWWTPRLIDKAHDFFHYPDFINRVRVQRRIAAMTNGQPASWYIDSIPEDKLEEYRRDLDSTITAIRAHGAKPIVATYPNRFGTHPAEADHDLLEAWRQCWPKARIPVMLGFMDAGAAVARKMAACRGVPVADLVNTIGGHRELFDDFVHYTEAGSSLVAETVKGAVLTAVADSIRPDSSACR
jgi:hypothetical protein